MSREIKFRVWSESDKEYRADLLSELTPPFITADYNDEGDRFDIEQYTGLKDKNGKEIYEGDIVELPIELSMATFGVVKYGYGRFYIEDYKYKDGKVHVVDFYDYNTPEKDLAVAGNIHENPELLKS